MVLFPTHSLGFHCRACKHMFRGGSCGGKTSIGGSGEVFKNKGLVYLFHFTLMVQVTDCAVTIGMFACGCLLVVSSDSSDADLWKTEGH